MDGYIKKSDAVDVIVKYPYNIAGKTATAIKMIESLPDADVVPKSEVENVEAEIERLKHILNCYALQYGTVTEQQKVIDEAKIGFASEIFAEIEEIFNNRIVFYTDMKKQPTLFFMKQYAEAMIANCNIYLQDIAELKKKYIGG